jgi:hypothetical protein
MATVRRNIRAGEVALECEVSGVIGAMPFLWLAIDDDAGPGVCAGSSSETQLRSSAITGKSRSIRRLQAGLGTIVTGSGSAAQGSGIQTMSMKAIILRFWERWSG